MKGCYTAKSGSRVHARWWRGPGVRRFVTASWPGATATWRHRSATRGTWRWPRRCLRQEPKSQAPESFPRRQGLLCRSRVMGYLAGGSAEPCRWPGFAARAAGGRIVASLRENVGDAGAVARFHERTAERYTQLLGGSKGVLMKVGQIFSMFDTD